MPHADSASLYEGVKTKAELWDLIHDRLQALLEGETNWVSNCANAASLIYNVMLASPELFGTGERAVNWCGFYIDASMFPTPQLTIAKPESTKAGGNSEEPSTRKLLLGPFCGKPACQFINVTPGKSRGVCADAFMKQESVLVHDVNTYPGHIACDGETNGELVCPLSVLHQGRRVAVGVLDMDCVGLGGFDDDDRRGAEKVADLVANACKW